MNKKEFQKYLDRDKRCPHCGTDGADLIPQHRLNRGMGGSKIRNRPSNVIVFCSYANGKLESSPVFAEIGRRYGWKLRPWQDPSKTEVFLGDGWYLLDDNFGKVKTAEPSFEE